MLVRRSVSAMQFYVVRGKYTCAGVRNIYIYYGVPPKLFSSLVKSHPIESFLMIRIYYIQNFRSFEQYLGVPQGP